jgi:F0F1-type ATP synthase assembly protein I
MPKRFSGRREPSQERAVEPPGNKTSSHTPEDPEGNQSAPTAWAYASEGTQMAVTLLVGIFVGYKLDGKFGLSPWCTVAGATLGIVVGLYGFLKRALKW